MVRSRGQETLLAVQWQSRKLWKPFSNQQIANHVLDEEVEWQADNDSTLTKLPTEPVYAHNSEITIEKHVLSPLATLAEGSVEQVIEFDYYASKDEVSGYMSMTLNGWVADMLSPVFAATQVLHYDIDPMGAIEVLGGVVGQVLELKNWGMANRWVVPVKTLVPNGRFRIKVGLILGDAGSNSAIGRLAYFTSRLEFLVGYEWVAKPLKEVSEVDSDSDFEVISDDPAG